jgi:phenylpropionate dioxygenase-like ring-hydroxylating dioxygenase large terminal subunit
MQIEQTPAWDFYRGLEPFWHPVLEASRLGDRPVLVELLGRPLTLVRLGGEPACLDDVCRHMGASLALGEVVDGCRPRCPYHGWPYDRSGRCMDIPARRDAPIPRDARVGSYQVTERYGLVWACLAEEPVAETTGGDQVIRELETVMYTNYCTPTSIRLLKDGPAGRYSIFEAVSPVRHDRSLVFLRMAGDFDRDPARDRSYMELEDRIQEQDRPVAESQRPWLLPPPSSRLLLYVRPADLPLIAFQRWLEELGIPQI